VADDAVASSPELDNTIFSGSRQIFWAAGSEDEN